MNLLRVETEIASNGTNNHDPVIEYRISYKMLGTSPDSLSFCESNMFCAVEFWIERGETGFPTLNSDCETVINTTNVYYCS
jgi:hypothetical protein